MANLIRAASSGLSRFTGRASRSALAQRATFVGVATLTTTRPGLCGPYEREFGAGLLLDGQGGTTVTEVDVERVHLGSVTCLISLLPGTGSGAYVRGRLHLSVGLYFGVDVLRGAQDSEVTFSLEADSSAGSDGQLTLSGTSRFRTGYLGGRLATLTVTGAITQEVGEPVAILSGPRRSAPGPRPA
jgi:hypothetical protein